MYKSKGISKSLINRIRNMINNGKTSQQIANVLKLTFWKVKKLRYQFKLHSPVKRPSKQEINQLRKLCKLHLSEVEISEEIHWTRRKVQYWMSEYGIKKGKKQIPSEEIEYQKELLNRGLTIIQVVGEMEKKFKKKFSFYQIKGRMDGYRLKTTHNLSGNYEKFTSNEIKLIKKLFLTGVLYDVHKEVFPNRTIQSIFYKVKDLKRTGELPKVSISSLKREE